MEYHGSKNWEGLLDPLDEGLRGEIIRYGSFVEAAYQSFDFDPSSSTYASCRYTKSTILERSGVDRYRVTKNLFATSSIPLPRWIEKLPRWVQVQSSWIGYVAVCEDKNEISRLGRRDIVIALRGTATCLEWLENLRATLTHCNVDNDNEKIHESMVEAGVLSLYTSGTTKCPSLQQLLQQEILRLLKLYGEEPVSLTFTGHSLGASLAILAAYDIKTIIKHSPHLSVISFGGPRVGNRSFRHQLEKQGTKILRIVNSDDLITKVPGFFVEESNDVVHEHNARVTHITEWIQTNVNDSRWVYANIGHELRLSSRDSLQLNSINIATCHDLKTYLDLVNGFVSSTCPFRAGARKMLNKATTIPSIK
ncbi:phospholipase A(1) DAD1, chloroplastic [Rutidosis leptorrhynchoides]|uniref:phospholipase A(1) DAD1, chloroplastic n=1 Tax=Rutidosis leptorrhynchoides TaxID=125765 RepID=UPI003A992CF8